MITNEKHYIAILSLAAGLMLSSATPSAAADFAGRIVNIHSHEENGIGGLELRPQSSVEEREDIGMRVHTHLRVLVPNQPITPFSAYAATSPSSSPNLNTPSSIACIYNLVTQPRSQPAGCNPEKTSVNPAGGGGAIALVDAYDDPNAATDLAAFSQYFGIPAAKFQTVYAGGPAPYITGPQPASAAANGWDLEEALDVEWSHAMAPQAKVFLVEAQSNSIPDLFTAIMAAEYLVSQNGGGEVSMSWGSSEFSQETQFDAYFAPGHSPANVVFVAASGDAPNVVEYPASSPYVIASGGTTINRNSAGAFVSETAWADGAGGISVYETRPSFQNVSSVKKIVGSGRGVPDISLDSDPNTGVAVYMQGSWIAVGGTSVASPANAGIINVADYANRKFPTAPTELGKLYADNDSSADFRNITSGGCGTDKAGPSYDLCTGWGSLFSYKGK